MEGKPKQGGDRSAQAKAAGKKMGRPPKPKVDGPPLSKCVAVELYNDPITKQRWADLRNAMVGEKPDMALRFQVEREIAHQAGYKPVQAVRHETDEPIKINVTIRRVGAKS